MCKSCDWESSLQECEDLLTDEDYAFASDTLEGIRDWIQTEHHVTERQQTAIENIGNSKR